MDPGWSLGISDMPVFPVPWVALGSLLWACHVVAEKMVCSIGLLITVTRTGGNKLKQGKSDLAPGFRGLSCVQLSWQRGLCGTRKIKGETTPSRRCACHRSRLVPTLHTTHHSIRTLDPSSEEEVSGFLEDSALSCDVLL